MQGLGQKNRAQWGYLSFYSSLSPSSHSTYLFFLSLSFSLFFASLFISITHINSFSSVPISFNVSLYSTILDLGLKCLKKPFCKCYGDIFPLAGERTLDIFISFHLFFYTRTLSYSGSHKNKNLLTHCPLYSNKISYSVRFWQMFSTKSFISEQVYEPAYWVKCYTLVNPVWIANIRFD